MREIKRSFGDHDIYNPISLQKFSDEDLRKEYARMRKELNKQVKEIKKSGEFDNAAVINRTSDFPIQSRIKDKGELILRLTDLEGLLTMNVSSLQGLRQQRDRTIQTFNDIYGSDVINESNFERFISFLDSTKSISLSLFKYKYDEWTGEYSGRDKYKRFRIFKEMLKHNISDKDLNRAFTLMEEKNITASTLANDFKFFMEHMDEIERIPSRKHGRAMGSRTMRKLIKELE